MTTNLKLKATSNYTKNNLLVTQVVHDGMRRFKQGIMRESYTECNTVVSKTRKQLAENPATIQRIAQLLADLNNFKNTVARIMKPVQDAIINAINLPSFQKAPPKFLVANDQKIAE